MSGAILQLVADGGKTPPPPAYACAITEYRDVTVWPECAANIINKVVIRAARFPREVSIYGRTLAVGKHAGPDESGQCWYFIDANCPNISGEPGALRGPSTIWIDATYTENRKPEKGPMVKASRALTELPQGDIEKWKSLPPVLTHVTWGDADGELKANGVTLLDLRGDSKKKAVEYMYGREYHLGNCMRTERLDGFEFEQ